MASGIRNPNATYAYRGDDWSPDSFWTFRREQTSDDRDRVQAMTTRTIVGSLDRKKVRELLRKGESVEDYIAEHTKTDTMMSAEKAMLAVMATRVEGEFFTIPLDYTDDQGNPHPSAGHVIPQPPQRALETTNRIQYEADLAAHVAWLGMIDPEERTNALLFMNRVWAGRDPDAQKEFQSGSGRVDGPVPGQSGEAGA